MRKVVLLGLLFAAAFSCKEDDADLPPVEQRVSEAIASLRGELTAPANGWRLNYRPTNASGTFFILLKFTEDGSVQIQSDVPANNGAFYNETITYRIDSGLGLELIFETFAVFHHLFELDQATFGGEFEFQYVEKTGDNLVFESISDFSFPTVITLEPADADDADSFAREVAENLEAFRLTNPILFGGIAPSQQLILNDRNMSIFWSIDLNKRTMTVGFAGIGTTAAEIISNNRVQIDHFTGYTFSNGSLVLEEPFSFTLSGQNLTIGEVELTNFISTAPSLCSTNVATDGPRYDGQISGVGTVSLVNNLLNAGGLGFQTDLYSVNAQFIFDDQGRSLLDEGSLGEKFPGAEGFLFVYDTELNDENIPVNSVGFTFTNETDNTGFVYMREFQATQTDINKIQITLLDNYYFSQTPPAGTQAELEAVTDEIFGNGEFYAFDLAVDGATVFRLFNPCNNYEFFLVR